MAAEHRRFMERFWGDIANSTQGFPYVTAVTETVIAHIHYHRTLHKTHLVSGNCLQLPHLEHRGSFQWSPHSRRHGYWNRPLYMAMFAGLIIVRAGMQRGLDRCILRRYPRLSLLL